MELSKRLESICSLVEPGNIGADIGTDHGYIPIYLVKNGRVNSFIASDINKGPVEKAKFNVSIEGLKGKIECRHGSGLKTLRKGEAEFVIIAGMGGNLIRDIILASYGVFKNLNYAILQPTQNPEVLREFLIKEGITILEEELCYDEGIYYEIIKVKFEGKKPENVDPIYYEISSNLMEKRHPLVKDYIEFKINKNKKIINNIKDNTEAAIKRKEELRDKIKLLQEMMECL